MVCVYVCAWAYPHQTHLFRCLHVYVCVCLCVMEGRQSPLHRFVHETVQQRMNVSFPQQSNVQICQRGWWVRVKAQLWNNDTHTHIHTYTHMHTYMHIHIRIRYFSNTSKESRTNHVSRISHMSTNYYLSNLQIIQLFHCPVSHMHISPMPLSLKILKSCHSPCLYLRLIS